MPDTLQCTYLIWQGSTPDKGVAFTSVVEYDKAREKLREHGIRFHCAVVPILPVEIATGEINRIINEQTAKEKV